MDRGFSMIVTEGLSKQYGGFSALSDLNMEIRKGEVYGLLGPNGSGKTTTIRLLLGLLRPTSGRAIVAGFDSWDQSLQVRGVVSYLPGELRLIGSMSGLGLLKFLCSLRGGDGLDRSVVIAERIMKLDLRRKVRNYSTGMKQKLALSQAFADPVEILILDEPTSALDPSARADVLGLIVEARRAGQTVIFSGHVLSEVEEIADRVAIMRQGQLMHVEDMRNRQGLRLVLVKYGGEPPEACPDELQLTLKSREGNVDLFEHRGEVGPLLAWLQSVNVVDLAIGTEDLKSLYEQFHGTGAPDLEVILK
jgi:ABC-2 type transport system ATP-binding protein